MLHSDMNPLPYNPVTNLLVDLNADGALGDVPDTTSAAMVEFVGHALVNGAIYLDVHIVTNLVGPEISGQWDVTLLSEGSGKQIPGPRSETVTSWHFSPSLVFLPSPAC